MATVVIAGLMLSSLLTLVFIPVVYTIFDNTHIKYVAKKEAKKEKKLNKKLQRG